MIHRFSRRAGKLEYVQQAFSATTEATPEALFEVVSDIATYPHWLDLVSAVEPTEQTDAWLVTLKGRVGPFSRSKRLRMVRTVHEPVVDDSAATVRFERREVDGKEHSDWTLAASVDSTDGPQSDGDSKSDDAQRSVVSLDLRYDGTLWSGLLDGLLSAAADRATAKLRDYVKSPSS